MSTQNSDIIRYLLFRLREVGKNEQGEEYQNLFAGLKRELQSSFAIDLRPSSKSSWLRVKEYLDDDDVLIFLKAFVESDVLKTLTRLDLSHNRIGERSAVALAESFCQVFVPSLTHLDLSGNRIGERSLIALAKVIVRGHLPGLTWLDLSKNSYSSTTNGERESKAFAKALLSGNLSHLQHLGLPSCNVDNIIATLWQGRISHISSIDLSGYITDTPITRRASTRELLEIIEHMPLEHIHLRRCGLTWDVMEEFTQALISRGDSQQYLQRLDLSENILGVRGIVALGRVMKEGHLGNLTHLSLGQCGIEEIYPLRALEDGILSGNISSLVHLDLSSNNFGFIGTCALVNMMDEGRLSNLLHLNVSNCNMRMVSGLETLRPGKLFRRRSYLELYERDVFDFIASMSKGNLSRLSVLDLSFNKLGTQGCTALAGVIEGGNLPHLHELHLCGCGIKDTGIVRLVEVLHFGHLQRLQHLDLGFNKFDSPGVEALTGLLKENVLPNLRFLNIYLLRLGKVPLSGDELASTHESLYRIGQTSRSLIRDKDILERISVFWAQNKRRDRLVRREAMMPQLVSGLLDAYSCNDKLETTVVGLGEYDSILQATRDCNMQYSVRKRPANDDLSYAFLVKGVALLVAMFALGFYCCFMNNVLNHS